MSFKPFKKLYLSIKQVADPDTLLNIFNQLQGNIEQSFQPLNKIQNDSTILPSIQLVAGQVNVVNHTLGRKLLGWDPSRVRSQATIWDDQDNNPLPGLTLWLYTDTDVTVDLRVY